MQTGKKYLKKSPIESEQLFAKNERGAILREGLFLLLYYPEIINDNDMDLVGSWVDNINTPCLSSRSNGLILAAYSANVSSQYCDSVSCAKDMKIG